VIVGAKDSQPEVAERLVVSDREHRAREQLLDALCLPNSVQFAEAGRQRVPSSAAVADVLQDLQAVLYPSLIGGFESSRERLKQRLAVRLHRAEAALREQIRRALESRCEHTPVARDKVHCTGCAARAGRASGRIVARLPELRATLDSDIQAAFDGDPSASSIEEVLCCSPGFRAILSHRIAHELQRLSVPLIPRIMSEVARAATGIDIHPAASIDSSFFIDHGTGVVIGETACIGKRVRLYQGVTLGARTFPVDAEGKLIRGLPRHPIIQDDVIIYAGATILGRITIGRGARIGCNACVTRDVAPHMRSDACLEKPECG
jgi:serine O-acetyltransferase